MNKVIFPYGLIYGPHPSRRLGLSLGVDLTPMACTFSCLYCERGRTLLKCRNHREFTQMVDIDIFLDSLKQQIKNVKIDCLTFAGTGEPTLELRLGEFISSARKLIGQIPIKVITNSSLLTHSSVRKNLAEADEVIAKLNAASNDIFIEMHRPFNENLVVEEIIYGFSLT